MTAVNSNQTSIRGLRGVEVSFTQKARRIQSKALGGEARVIRLGRIVFFPSTKFVSRTEKHQTGSQTTEIAAAT